MTAQAVRKINFTEKDLKTLSLLVQASDPHQVLKKGFTLTLDEENRVIKSLEAFNRQERATLKFHDGTTTIKKEE